MRGIHIYSSPILLIPNAKSERRIEPSNALKNPSTSNPGVIAPASINSKAFITNENKPNVNIFIGNEMNCNNGLINVLISARITHTSIALKKFSTVIPGIIQDTKITAKA